MKKRTKWILAGLGALVIAALAAAVFFSWHLGLGFFDPALRIPAEWSLSGDWSAEPRPGAGESILLRDCRIGDAQHPWLTAPVGSVNQGILTLENAVLAPESLRELSGWLLHHQLPVRVVAVTATDAFGEYLLTGDRQSGNWVRTRQYHGGSERVVIDEEAETGSFSGRELPGFLRTWQPVLELAPEALTGEWQGSWRKRHGAPEPDRLEIRCGNAELIWQPDGWRFTLREVTWPEPVNLHFRRVTLTGQGTDEWIRATGEAAAPAAGTQTHFPAGFPLENAAFSGECHNGEWRWELRGAAAQTYQGDALEGSTGAWTAQYDPAAGMTLAGVLTAVTVKGAALRLTVPELRFHGVWRDNRWSGSWEAAQGLLPPLLPGWSAGTAEALSGAFPLAADWRIEAAKIKWRHPDPEWSLIADQAQLQPRQLTIQLAALDGVEWQSLWREVQWRSEEPLTARRMELHIPVREFSAAVESCMVSYAGLETVLSGRGWEWSCGAWGGRSGTAEMAELARGEITAGSWRGRLTLRDFSGTLPPEGRLRFGGAVLDLPVEFPDAGLRPSAAAKADAATGLYRTPAVLAPGSLQSPDVRWEQLTLGEVKTDWTPRHGNGGWNVSGKLAVRELAGTELYFATEKEHWEWLLPAAEWSENRLPLYFPGWSGWTLRGMVGLHSNGGGTALELRGADFGRGGWLASGVSGDVKLTTLAQPVTAGKAELAFQRLSEWGPGTMCLEVDNAGKWHFSALSGAWCGGTLTLAAPVNWQPEKDEITIYPFDVADVRLDAALRHFGIAAGESELRLEGEGEWHWLQGQGWQFGGMTLRSGIRTALRLPEVAAQVAGSNHTAEFFRCFLRDFDCRSLRLSWLPDNGGGGMTLKLGVTASPAQPLPFVFSGDEADPLIPARPGEPSFQGEIDFEISLQIP